MDDGQVAGRSFEIGGILSYVAYKSSGYSTLQLPRLFWNFDFTKL